MSTQKDNGPKTTVWGGSNGNTLVATLQGLPYGIPSTGTVVYIHGHGEAFCSGVTTTASGTNESVVEIKFRLRDPCDNRR